MFSTLLVPLDGSDLAARAVPYAAFLARAAGGEVILLHAASTRATDSGGDAEIEVSTDLDRLVEQLTQDGIRATASTVHGEAGSVIVQAVTEHGADLIVTSTHGRGGVGRLMHGSVADELLRHAAVPVLLVTPACTREWDPARPLRILIPLDGSALAEEAIPPALKLARSNPVEVWLLQVAEERIGVDALGFGFAAAASDEDVAAARAYVEQAATPFRQEGYPVTVGVEAGRPEAVIEHVAQREAIDLVVMATHGQGGLRTLLLEGMATVVTAGRLPLHLGSIAAASIQHLSVPVLLVQPVSIRPASSAATLPAPAHPAGHPAGT